MHTNRQHRKIFWAWRQLSVACIWVEVATIWGREKESRTLLSLRSNIQMCFFVCVCCFCCVCWYMWCDVMLMLKWLSGRMPIQPPCTAVHLLMDVCAPNCENSQLESQTIINPSYARLFNSNFSYLAATQQSRLYIRLLSDCYSRLIFTIAELHYKSKHKLIMSSSIL